MTSAMALAATACVGPPVRTGEYRRVLIVGDSLINGSATLEGYPSLAPVLQPMLAEAGVDVRFAGVAGSTPLNNRWSLIVREQVETWDPDLVILGSVIPGDPDTFSRQAVEWGWINANASARGADAWRIVPPVPVPGTFIDTLYHPTLQRLRDVQALGMRAGSSLRSTTVDLDAALAGCHAAWTWDGGHLTEQGQTCFANALFLRIVGRPYSPPTTTPATAPATTPTEVPAGP